MVFATLEFIESFMNSWRDSYDQVMPLAGMRGSIAANMLAAFLAPKMLIRKFLSAFSVPKILIKVFEAAFWNQNFRSQKFWLKNAAPKILISIFGTENAGENFESKFSEQKMLPAYSFGYCHASRAKNQFKIPVWSLLFKIIIILLKI